MHFVLTPTDPSVAHVNLDLQEMEKTAQVVFSVVRVFSYGSRNFISSLSFFHSFPLLQLASYSNATTEVTLFSLVILYIVHSQEENKFFVM